MINVLNHPFGCYELSRYDGDYEAMMREVMSIYAPLPAEDAREKRKEAVR